MQVQRRSRVESNWSPQTTWRSRTRVKTFYYSHNADFLYFDVAATNINVIFENNMVRFKGKNNNVKFGKIIDVDGTKYYATEI